MRFTCSQTSLLKAVNMVSKAVSAKTTVPALKGILLTVENNSLSLTGSDLDFSVITSIEAADCENGSTIVNAKLFSDIIRKLPNGMVKFCMDELGRVSVSCIDSKFNIIGISADEYPNLGSSEDAVEFTVNNKDFRSLINKTSFAASIDEKKGILIGCLIDFSSKKIEMASLDGFRMAVASKETYLDQNFSVIVPASILGEISKLLSELDSAEYVKIKVEEKKIRIEAADVVMVSRLLEGEFIKYNDILPKTYRTRVIVDRAGLQDSVERASLFVIEGKNNLIKLSISENGIDITSRNEAGNVEDHVAAEVEGESLEIGFNSKYLMDVLKVINDEDIALEMTGSLSACVIRPAEGNEYSYLVLPVRLTI